MQLQLARIERRHGADHARFLATLLVVVQQMHLYVMQRTSQRFRQTGDRPSAIALSSVELCSASSTLFAGYHCASTARSARLSGVDNACAQLRTSIGAMAGGATTIEH
jgi:hypothetical protein